MAEPLEALVRVLKSNYALLKLRNTRSDVALLLLPGDCEAFDKLRLRMLVEIDEVRILDRGPRALGVRAVPESDPRYKIVSCDRCGACYLIVPGFGDIWTRQCPTCRAGNPRHEVTHIEAAPLDVAAADIVNTLAEEPE